MAGKGRRVVRIAGAAAILLLMAVLLDAAGLVRPRPTPQKVMRQMAAAWEAMPAYHAEVSTGQWGAGAPGLPMTSRQWFWKREQVLVLATQDEAGFRHAERWRDSAWNYYQPGAEIQADVRISGADEVPYAGWLVTQYPTVGDLIAVIHSTADARVTGQERLTGGPAWILECTPPEPAGAAGLPARHPAREFYRRFWGAPWKVWVSQRSRLPEHILITPGSGQPSVRIGVDNLVPGPAAPFADWKQALDKAGLKPRLFSLECDLRSVDQLDSARRRIRTVVDAWRTPLLGGRSGLRK